MEIVMNIWIVNESSCSDEAGETWYFSTKKNAEAFMDDLKEEYKQDETYEEYPKENSFGKDGCRVYMLSVQVDK